MSLSLRTFSVNNQSMPVFKGTANFKKENLKWHGPGGDASSEVKMWKILEGLQEDSSFKKALSNTPKDVEVHCKNNNIFGPNVFIIELKKRAAKICKYMILIRPHELIDEKKKLFYQDIATLVMDTANGSLKGSAQHIIEESTNKAFKNTLLFTIKRHV